MQSGTRRNGTGSRLEHGPELETARCYVLDDEATGMSRLMPLLFMLWGCGVIAGTLLIAVVRVLRGSQHRLDYTFAVRVWARSWC